MQHTSLMDMMVIKKPLQCFKNSYVYERYSNHPLIHVTILVNAY